jgi:hypothetical protein
MEQLAEQLKCSGIDLVWWPVFLGSYQSDSVDNAGAAISENACSDYEETLP